MRQPGVGKCFSISFTLNRGFEWCVETEDEHCESECGLGSCGLAAVVVQTHLLDSQKNQKNFYGTMITRLQGPYRNRGSVPPLRPITSPFYRSEAGFS